jgi:putative membrane-bound dehydrogenase-like protein
MKRAYSLFDYLQARFQRVAYALACMASLSYFAHSHGADDTGWQTVKAPEVWKKPPAGKQGYGWYRCMIHVPASWQGRNFELFVESVDDSREFYINGTRVGTAGAFPPEFRSGLGEPSRYQVDSTLLLVGQPNVVAIRVYDSDGRGGFNVAAPVLFAGDEAIRMEGSWQFRAGDNPEWSKLQAEALPATEAHFASVQSAVEVAKILRRLPGEEGPLSPGEALRRFKTSPGLEVELALSEPNIGQPLSMKFDERGRMWVVQYLQYPSPAGLKMVSRDKFLRSVYDKTPLPPPNHFSGADKISIHEDTNGDGAMDKHSTFVSGLSLATSFEFDRDGLWVLNPPYLLFYPDKNHDDIPDGDPQVHLEGFGIEDSHSVTNNLRWGPDGWLYASQGSTVTGNIRLYGSNDKPVHSMGQVIWRYHPKLHRFEIFAEGGGNSFGVEFDSKGRVYSGHNGGDTRGFHFVQGGYYQKGFGKHGALSNPYTFGYFEMMKHHSVPRFTHCFVIYEGGALGSEYQGKLFGVSPLLNHIVYSKVSPLGSTFATTDIGQALSTDDPWFRPVDIQAGPDGAIYIADMYEQRIDHAAHYQGRIDRESGRIYRLKKSGVTDPKKNLAASVNVPETADSLLDKNKWVRQNAQRLWMQANEPSLALNDSEKKLFSSHGQESLELLWAIHLAGGLTEEVAMKALSHDDPYVRLWTARLLCDSNIVSEGFATALAQLAVRETHVEVRSQLACSAKRLPAEQCLPIIEKLLAHDEDFDDLHIPLLLWWAIESKAEAHRESVIALFESPDLWRRAMVSRQIVERLMRRYAQSGTQKDLLSCARLLELAPENEHVKSLMAGFEKAYEGRSLTGLPEPLVAIMAKRGGGSLALRLRQADPESIAESLQWIANEKVKKSERIQIIQVLGQIHPAGGIDPLLTLVEGSRDSDVRVAALTALQGYDSPKIGSNLVSMNDRFTPDIRSVSVSLLASRLEWTKALLAAIDSGKIATKDVPIEVVQRMALHDDATFSQSIQKHWGTLQGTNNEEMRKKIIELTGRIESGTGNPYKGKVLYKANCGKCHRLFDDGGFIGPDLTQYKRDDLATILVNVVNPSLQIREGFEAFHVLTSDGLVLNGFISDQDNRIVVLRTADGQSIVVPREDIDSMKASPVSIMPAGLLDPLGEQDVRDLFAYLRATQPLN